MKKIISLTLTLVLVLATVLTLASCTKKEEKTITVAASPTPHAEILEIAKEILAEKGITLVIKEFTDYVQPNNVVEDGQVDANYFQHVPYLDDFNKENGTNIVSVGGIHVEPMGLYAASSKDLTKLNSTDGANIVIPNDTTNEARALLLLEANGYIKLKDNAGITATPDDIVENTHNLTFTEINAELIPQFLTDSKVDYAVINSNYAIDAGINPVKDSLIIEGGYSQYANILAVKAGNEGTWQTKALLAALQSQKVADYIKNTYGGAVVSTVENPGNGYDSTLDYSNLK